MFIVVSGNVNADHVLELCDRYLKDPPPVTVETMPYNEPQEVVCDYKEQPMSVSLPQFIWGIKLDCEGYLPLKNRTEISMILSAFLGQQSPLYNQLLKEGLINKSFGVSLFDGRNFACILFSGESSDPKLVVEKIKTALSELQQKGIDPQEFELIRRQFYGRYLMSFNNVEGIGDALTDCACDNSDLFDEARIFANVTVNDLNERLLSDFKAERSALSVVLPNK